jgi:hypothetical protein
MLSSTLDLDKSTSNSQMERYTVTLIVILIMNSPKRTAIGEDVDPAVKQPSPWRMDGQITQEKYQGMKTARMNGTLKTRRLRSLLMKKLHNQIMIHRPLGYRERRCHQHQRHKKSKHLILQDQMMHLNSKYLLVSSPVQRTIKFNTLVMR